MGVFAEMGRNRHENLLFFQHRDSGLRGVLAIHDSSLGPAVGGVRCWNYASEDELCRDALRLSESASLSAALFGCDAGGGKAIIWANPEEKNEVMLRAFGIFLQSLGGRFIASAELGTTSQDMDVIGKETQFVAGLLKGQGVESDYSAITARGVFLGMKAAAKVVFGTASLKDRKIAVQGLGKVGTALLELLAKEGARLSVSDLYFEKVKAARDRYPGIEMVPPEEIPFHPVDILAPCALGGLLTPETVGRLKCKIVAGAATNQLSDDSVADLLAKSGILYLPDFLLSAGDIIMVNSDMYGIPTKTCLPTVERVYGLAEELLVKVQTTRQTPTKIAREWALDRMRRIRTLKKIYKPTR
ncbi:MAG: Leucine dehydrogenase [Candidatus Ozemobacter sibiricus]|uniref:Leucine dehydrogenase n=1 Tax=Candidatus Ozemobacter sibiricus TaxID=2268124 RepID=A0A367ZUC8_9BACT|nr:MAG: Leucine dehydrogenase [Candidatus Ozemobacter sibiricus]